MNVGLTGGIACGKSTVSRMLEARGAKIVDADRIARDVVLPGRPALLDIRETFGEDVIAPDGTLDRKRLGSIVFGDESARRKLEAITHPRIREEMARQMSEWNEKEPERLVVADIPLLYESGLDKLYAFEDVLVVYVPREVQLERLMARDGMSREDAERRIDAQMPIEEKRKRADVVIDNSGSLAETERQVEAYVAGKTGST
ncbi:dephospho-CoA kinase [Paenibacillus antri]|uniref:Dephospho-CoA kinase n=1 Tax=Paenibacillus antri TaxID=2582848 RepID=A0A5R9FWH4_9BACL|nr:dephospho-CoA kinase [Paenibacillus antri]TLS48422.1 dephospho-CoA kinase [Paenibacillus antri]